MKYRQIWRESVEDELSLLSRSSLTMYEILDKMEHYPGEGQQ
jgi:hypothetical protein